MKVRGYLLYAVLIAIAAALAIAAGDRRDPDDRPSIDATGPHGLRALYLYLKESNRPVTAHRAPLADLDTKTRTLIIAAPTAQPFNDEDVEALRAFVQKGGTLVYLRPRSGGRTKALDAWLKVEGPGARLSGLSTTSPDARLEIWQPFGALAGLRALQVSPEETVKVRGKGAIAVAGQKGLPALWREAFGDGEVWIAAGSDLAANSRIAQEDNLAFWDHLAQRGPIAFDELHQDAAEGPPMSPAALAFAAQFLLMGLLFIWANGSRLGPPRMPPEVRHRASREYLTAFGTLLRRAHVEGELAGAMLLRLRRGLRERLGIPLSLSDEEAARALELGAGIPASDFLSLVEALRAASGASVSPRGFLALARRTARIEAALGGQATASEARAA